MWLVHYSSALGDAAGINRVAFYIMPLNLHVSAVMGEVVVSIGERRGKNAEPAPGATTGRGNADVFGLLRTDASRMDRKETARRLHDLQRTLAAMASALGVGEEKLWHLAMTRPEQMADALLIPMDGDFRPAFVGCFVGKVPRYVAKTLDYYQRNFGIGIIDVIKSPRLITAPLPGTIMPRFEYFYQRVPDLQFIREHAAEIIAGNDKAFIRFVMSVEGHEGDAQMEEQLDGYRAFKERVKIDCRNQIVREHHFTTDPLRRMRIAAQQLGDDYYQEDEK